jgi:hypothetical protein
MPWRRRADQARGDGASRYLSAPRKRQNPELGKVRHSKGYPSAGQSRARHVKSAQETREDEEGTCDRT